MGLHMQGAGVREETSVTSEKEYTDLAFPCQEEAGWVGWMVCRRGETGRHARFRTLWATHVGSSPTDGTTRHLCLLSTEWVRQALLLLLREII